MKLFYVSDIHMEYKIQMNTLPEEIPEEEFAEHIKQNIIRLLSSTLPHRPEDYLLIAGDTFEFVDIARWVLAALVSIWDPSHIIMVLGNHEFWIADPDHKLSGDEIKEGYAPVMKYWKEEFGRWGIRLLTDTHFSLPGTKITVFGGTGFSGLNQQVCAESGAYGTAIVTTKKDKELSAKCERNFLKEAERCAKRKRQLVVLTHNPPSDWLSTPIGEGMPEHLWFISGHTHQNKAWKEKAGNGEISYLQDGQLGYREKETYRIKYIEV